MSHQEVLVINKGTKTFTDKHHGIEYTFKPNDKVSIPIAAAAHIFGLGMQDRSLAWKRLGFTQPDTGIAWLEKFSLKVVDLVPAGVDVEEGHRKEIAALEENNAKTLEQIKKEHNEEISRLVETHEKEIAELKKSHKK